MDKRQAQSNGKRCETIRSFTVCRAHDDDQEKERHYDLAYERRERCICSRRSRSIAKTICRESTGEGKTGLSAGDQEKDTGSGDRSKHLRDHVRNKITSRKTLSSPQSKRNRGVEMSA